MNTTKTQNDTFLITTIVLQVKYKKLNKRQLQNRQYIFHYFVLKY